MKLKKLITIDEKLFNKVDSIAKETGLNFQNYVIMILTKKTKESEKGENK